MGIRLLKASEISVKPKQVFQRNGKTHAMLLLYKDSRCDMARLDEWVGAMNWSRRHVAIDGTLHCIVSIWDSEKGLWVDKQDVGTESMVEKQKGEASDSFKRACTNWGIGRELYSSPAIFVELRPDEVVSGERPKIKSSIRFHVSKIDYDELKEISTLVISDSHGVQRFKYPTKQTEYITRGEASEIMRVCKDKGIEKHVVEALDAFGIKGLSELKKSEKQAFIEQVESFRS